ncbi:transcription and mRNA export factor eny2 [Anaeramoeba ignava]|uniref:Transcription and mRNA export factor eny2 n=1 Tax=Anaeramoeba ignava TaxID=1746090 RepID=A0A9Q0LMB0_ANAIG|nr:transcription and mRNA export factor eny2 [Anaeramoeba ignava]
MNRRKKNPQKNKKKNPQNQNQKLIQNNQQIFDKQIQEKPEEFFDKLKFQFENSKEKKNIEETFRKKLIESNWKQKMETFCNELIESKGISNISKEKILKKMIFEGQLNVPLELRNELESSIRSFLETIQMN